MGLERLVVGCLSRALAWKARTMAHARLTLSVLLLDRTTRRCGAARARKDAALALIAVDLSRPTRPL